MKNKNLGKTVVLPTRQCCPICRKYVKASTRYPNYICSSCTKLAVNKKSQKVIYRNTAMDGHGCMGVIKETGERALSICFIKGIKVKVEEAYLGGLVFLPLKRIKT